MASQLPAELNRAAPEIYRTIRASGAASLRDWISDMFPHDQRSTQLFQSKFTEASLVGFKVARCRTHDQLMLLLATDDAIEVTMRAFVFSFTTAGPGM